MTQTDNSPRERRFGAIYWSVGGAALVFVLYLQALASTGRGFVMLDAGQVAVAIVQGRVGETVTGPGLTFSLNPLREWFVLDLDERTLEDRSVNYSVDKQLVTVTLAVGYRFDVAMAATVVVSVRADTVHIEAMLRDRLRSSTRDHVARATSATVLEDAGWRNDLEQELATELAEWLARVGVRLTAVRIVDIVPGDRTATEAEGE